MANEWDVIVLGAGHNGLACAGYMAKAGQRVLVLEARDVAGGGCATENVTVPGFTHNFHSNFHGLIHWGPVYRELELERHGARYVWPENQFAHVFEDGRALVCSLSLKETIKSIERFSKRDARVFAELAQSYREALEQAIIPALFAPPQPPSREFAPLEQSVDGLRQLWGAFTTPDHLARALFDSPEVQAWIGFWVAQLAGTGDVFGLGANYPVMLAGSLEPFGWAIAVGGSNKLAQAMVRFIEEHGGEVRVGAPVRQIEVNGDRAVAVRLDDGARIEGRTIASNLDPRVTFLELVGEGELDGEFARAVRRWRYDSMSMFCLYLALDQPVQWKAAEFEPKVARCFAVSMCDDLQQLEDNASDCRLGMPPRTPGLFSVHPSLFEPELAPAGKEACFVEQIAPYELREGRWEDQREPYAETVLARWSEYASGLEPENVLGRYISSPIDIERVMPSMRHGDWNHGEMSQDQLGVFRPFFEYPPYRTAFDNVYLCGASTHPGGSISGACGRNAAGAICEDLAIERWWEEVYA
jgi:phytoene dehydrogenase-like protein